MIATAHRMRPRGAGRLQAQHAGGRVSALHVEDLSVYAIIHVFTLATGTITI